MLPTCAIMRIAGVGGELNNFAKEIIRKNKLTLRLGGPPGNHRRFFNHILLVVRSRISLSERKSASVITTGEPLSHCAAVGERPTLWRFERLAPKQTTKDNINERTIKCLATLRFSITNKTSTTWTLSHSPRAALNHSLMNSQNFCVRLQKKMFFRSVADIPETVVVDDARAVLNNLVSWLCNVRINDNNRKWSCLECNALLPTN